MKASFWGEQEKKGGRRERTDCNLSNCPRTIQSTSYSTCLDRMPQSHADAVSTFECGSSEHILAKLRKRDTASGLRCGRH
jgi:hypothetical protein